MAIVNSFMGQYRFLSNFHLVNVRLDGLIYASTEHAYQGAKTIDAGEREWVRMSPTPNIAKHRGRQISMRPDWDTIKLAVMLDLTYQKFAYPDLRDMLLRTWGDELIEGNTWGDTFWGVCKGVGENNLGKILMEVRASLVPKCKHCGESVDWPTNDVCGIRADTGACL